MLISGEVNIFNKRKLIHSHSLSCNNINRYSWIIINREIIDYVPGSKRLSYKSYKQIYNEMAKRKGKWLPGTDIKREIPDALFLVAQFHSKSLFYYFLLEFKIKRRFQRHPL